MCAEICSSAVVREHARNGFTLVEMVIVVAIVAMIVGVAATSVADMSRASLRKTSGIVASAMKAAYDNAALSGLTYRLAFVIGDPKKNEPSKIRVESSKEVLAFDPETSTLARALQGRSDGVQWDEFATGATTADGSQGVDSLDGPSADLLDKVLGTAGQDSSARRSVGSSHDDAGDDKPKKKKHHSKDDDDDDPSKDTGFTEAAQEHSKSTIRCACSAFGPKAWTSRSPRVRATFTSSRTATPKTLSFTFKMRTTESSASSWPL